MTPSQAEEVGEAVAPPEASVQRPFDGLPPVEHLGRVLRACSESSDPAVAGNFLILTHMGPDPDAIGACEGLRLLIEKGFAFRCVVATHGRVHRAENVALLRTLDLDLHEYSGIDTSEFCGVLLVDTQPTFRHTVVPDDLPVVAVFDHHMSPSSDDPDAAGVPHQDVRIDLGATASILFATLFGLAWIIPGVWIAQRALHGRPFRTVLGAEGRLKRGAFWAGMLAAF
ncbi:MAG: hypothetical protein AAGG01_00085, partial [Planctomycetota bacterium]